MTPRFSAIKTAKSERFQRANTQQLISKPILKLQYSQAQIKRGWAGTELFDERRKFREFSESLPDKSRPKVLGGVVLLTSRDLIFLPANVMRILEHLYNPYEYQNSGNYLLKYDLIYLGWKTLLSSSMQLLCK